MACGIDANANRELQREANSSGYQLNAELCDVSRPEQVRAMVAKTVAQFGGLESNRKFCGDSSFRYSRRNRSIRTPMLEHASAHFSPGLPVNSVVERFGAVHPLARVGTVEEVAELAAFLLSNRSTFCGDYLVDEGLLAGIGVQ
jgi:NAD(P)-dependent dehydrogenase (short-subunit alcohol dehydrogenase family)